MSGTWFIQIVESFGNHGTDASDALLDFRTQDGFVGGRLLEPSPLNRDWRVQAFMQDEKEAAEFPNNLPDGVRRVLVLDSLRVALGIPTDYKADLVQSRPHHSSCGCLICQPFPATDEGITPGFDDD